MIRSGCLPSRILSARRSLMPPMIAGVPVVELLRPLVAGEHALLGVDDDDVVTAIDVRGVARLGLAAQDQRDLGGKSPDDEAFGVDQQPFLGDIRRFDRGRLCGQHGRSPPGPSRSPLWPNKWAAATAAARSHAQPSTIHRPQSQLHMATHLSLHFQYCYGCGSILPQIEHRLSLPARQLCTPRRFGMLVSFTRDSDRAEPHQEAQ